MRLAGKTVIITGAGQTEGEGIGNGRATAVLFAREGAKLLLANRSMASLEKTYDQIRAEGFDAECVVADVSQEEDCKALVEAALQKFGCIDVLHNNVGIASMDGDTTAIDLETWRNMFDINVAGAMLLSKHVLPAMRERKRGVITHVSSTAAIMSLPIIAYKVSKMALNEFTRWLAFENAPHNIRCNVLMLVSSIRPWRSRGTIRPPVRHETNFANSEIRQCRWDEWEPHGNPQKSHCSWPRISRPILPAR